MLHKPLIRQPLGVSVIIPHVPGDTSAHAPLEMPLKRHQTVQETPFPPKSFWSFPFTSHPLYSRINKDVAFVKLLIVPSFKTLKIGLFPTPKANPPQKKFACLQACNRYRRLLREITYVPLASRFVTFTVSPGCFLASKSSEPVIMDVGSRDFWAVD